MRVSLFSISHDVSPSSKWGGVLPVTLLFLKVSALCMKDRVCSSLTHWASNLSFLRFCSFKSAPKEVTADQRVGTDQVHLIRDHLYLGSYDAFLHISHRFVISLVPDQQSIDCSQMTRLHYELPSDFYKAWQEITPELPKIFALIDRARDSKQNILVHCQEGQTRSAAVVVAYLIHKESLSVEEAMSSVKEARPQVRFNKIVEMCLKKWQASLEK